MNIDMTFVPFSATTRMSGVDYNGRSIRKGAADSVAGWAGQALPEGVAGSRPGAARKAVEPAADQVPQRVARQRIAAQQDDVAQQDHVAQPEPPRPARVERQDRVQPQEEERHKGEV